MTEEQQAEVAAAAVVASSQVAWSTDAFEVFLRFFLVSEVFSDAEK